NITPDKATGIGAWPDDDFVRALREGVRPDGAHYFPVFPYTTYTRMTRDDALAIKAYLFSRAPVSKAKRDHDVGFPFRWRFLQAGWKLLFFRAGEFKPEASHSAERNRGAYLVEALSHCGECHTPRNLFGALNREKWLAGTADGPEGELAPNITPDDASGIGKWSEADIVQLFRIGFKPNFDDVQGTMAEAIEDGLKHLTDQDLHAIAVYLKGLPAIHNPIKRKRKGEGN
ncbi:MAG: cytochrome c, partial [Proteobacteria bacterium]|nr:cytochrome c [Pseudomonadota bacterium]